MSERKGSTTGATPERSFPERELELFFGRAEKSDPNEIQGLVSIVTSLFPPSAEPVTEERLQEQMTEGNLKVALDTVSAWLDDLGIEEVSRLRSTETDWAVIATYCPTLRFLRSSRPIVDG